MTTMLRCDRCGTVKLVHVLGPEISRVYGACHKFLSPCRRHAADAAKQGEKPRKSVP